MADEPLLTYGQAAQALAYREARSTQWYITTSYLAFDSGGVSYDSTEERSRSSSMHIESRRARGGLEPTDGSDRPLLRSLREKDRPQGPPHPSLLVAPWFHSPTPRFINLQLRNVSGDVGTGGSRASIVLGASPPPSSIVGAPSRVETSRPVSSRT